MKLLDRLLRRAEHAAHTEARRITCADLWAYLDEGRALAAQAGVDRVAALFHLIHGAGPPALPASDRGTALVELRNDSYTTMEIGRASCRERVSSPV